MRADRRDALVDFLLEAVADEGTTPFPADVLAGLRRVVRCEAVGDLRLHQRSRVPRWRTLRRDLQAPWRAGGDEGLPAHRRGDRRIVGVQHY